LTISDKDILDTQRAFASFGGDRTKTAAKLNLSAGGLARRLAAFKSRGFKPAASTSGPAKAEGKEPVSFDDILVRLRKTPLTVEQIAEELQCSQSAAHRALEDACERGVNLHFIDSKWSVEKAPPIRLSRAEARHDLTSNSLHEFRFGFVTDNHIGSKYARLDVLNDLYDRFAARGITQVFNAGNYIDGEARFNKFDLEIHGMDPQLRYLAEQYPQREGIKTYFIAGDDHEGWYGQREGIDIGRWTERVMRDNGREDFIYLGFMEADVDLINAKTNKSARMRVVHPGGGSSYAISYAMQKLVESYEGGDKPAVVLGGHYHKQEILNYRNCWIIQGGTTEDQTPFMRKKKLEAHVGGMIVTLEQDPNTGAIIRCNDIYRYFNKEYYRTPEKPRKERFSYGGKVTLPARSLGGV